MKGSPSSMISRNISIHEIRKCWHVCMDCKWKREVTSLITHCTPTTALAAFHNQIQTILREKEHCFCFNGEDWMKGSKTGCIYWIHMLNPYVFLHGKKHFMLYLFLENSLFKDSVLWSLMMETSVDWSRQIWVGACLPNSGTWANHLTSLVSSSTL